MATHVCIGLTRDVPVERDSNIIIVLLLLLFQINIHSFTSFGLIDPGHIRIKVKVCACVMCVQYTIIIFHPAS